MTLANWTPRKTEYGTVDNSDVAEPWLVGVIDFQGATYLRIKATGSWTAPEITDGPCQPDGYAGLAMADGKSIIPDCAYGALIGRFGGGSAGYLSTAPDTANGRPFPLGKFALIKIPADTIGPLFIGFNCKARPVKVVTLALTVEGAIPTL